MSLLEIALQISIGAVLIAIGCSIYRFVVGPSVVDRLLALDTLFLNSTCLIVIMGIFWATTFLFEAALLIAMLGFISTVALAHYFISGSVID